MTPAELAAQIIIEMKMVTVVKICHVYKTPVTSEECVMTHREFLSAHVKRNIREMTPAELAAEDITEMKMAIVYQISLV